MKGSGSMDKKHLHILWTNADETTARLMVMMYARGSMKNNWWEQVTVIVWGATVKLLAENQSIQEEMKSAQESGVKFVGCIACAEKLGLVSEMEKLGVELKKWGPPLTDLILTEAPLLTV